MTGDRLGCCAGFALLELLLAFALFVLSLSGVTALQLHSLRASEDAGRSLRATLLATDYLRRSAITGVPLSAGVPVGVVESQGACRADRCTERELALLLYTEWVLQLQGRPAMAERGALPGAAFCAHDVAGGSLLVLQWPRFSQVSPPTIGGGCSAPASAAVRTAHWWSYERAVP